MSYHISILLAALLVLSGCDEDSPSAGRLAAVWGRRGISEGRFQKPRAMTVDRSGNLYIVDMTARIQVFRSDGIFVRQWQTPDHTNGKPTGLSIGNDGNVLVADTHYFRVLTYSPEGKLLKMLGGTKGDKPGQFGLVTDVVQDSHNNYYVSEYGDFDRIQKYSPEGKYLLQWGGHGAEPGQFSRPQNLAVDKNDHIWVADACNHRIQCFDADGRLLKFWGREGSRPGELYYPYDIQIIPDGTLLVCEFGNNRIQRFTRDGKSLGCWGLHGRKEGELFNPWAAVIHPNGMVYVLDSNNHRVQVVQFE
jgi:streptogramin lyase